MKISPIWLLLLCALQPQTAAQDLEIVTVHGQWVSGVVTGLSDGGQGPELELTGGRSVSLSEVLELHGVAPRLVSGAIVRLVGGDELRGVIRAGDRDGETFVVDSPSLGEIAIEVDRLREMVLREGVRAEDLRVPENTDEDEAVFLPTRSLCLKCLSLHFYVY